MWKKFIDWLNAVPNAEPDEPKQLTPKEQATEDNEPWIDIISVDLDPDDLNNGSFELDWNDKFVTNLIRKGYKHDDRDTDADIVDRWFTQVCRNVATQVFEQEMADPEKRANFNRRINSRDIGDGRSEVG